MGHYYDIDFKGKYSEFGTVLFRTLREMNDDWEAVEAVLWQNLATVKRIRAVFEPLLEYGLWRSFICRDCFYCKQTHKSKGQNYDGLKDVLPYLILEPMEFSLYHELWEGPPRVTLLQPKEPE